MGKAYKLGGVPRVMAAITPICFWSLLRSVTCRNFKTQVWLPAILIPTTEVATLKNGGETVVDYHHTICFVKWVAAEFFEILRFESPSLTMYHVPVGSFGYQKYGFFFFCLVSIPPLLVSYSVSLNCLASFKLTLFKNRTLYSHGLQMKKQYCLP